MHHNKPYDLVLIGATGFTGRRAAAYIKQHAPVGCTWGIAARNREKLHRLANEIGIEHNDCFVVDTLKKETVDPVVSKARIIITTVGPYSLYGEHVIASCVEFGTHYLDITGEVDFIRSMMNKYSKQAQKNGAILIPFSGFDSVPADIVSYLLSQQFSSPDILRIKSYYQASGGFNGGTIATMMNKFETGEYKRMGDPKIIMEEAEQRLCKPKGAQKFGYDSSVKRWTTPFIMGAINSKVVYRTAELLRKRGRPYAEKIAYSEHSALGKWYNPVSFLLVSLLLIAIRLLGPFRWFRKLILALAPNPGEGPSEKMIENGFFTLLGIASDEKGNTRKIRLSFDGDPGNKATVTFLCESAFCLFEQLDYLGNMSGFQTPVSALGEALISRLSDKGLKIKDYHRD